MGKCRFAEIEHTADLALLIQAPDMLQLLDCASRALQATLALTFAAPPGRQIPLDLRGADPETLLVQWLEEQLYLIDTEGQAWHSWTLQAAGPLRFTAQVVVCPIDPPDLHIKAVTFHDLVIRKTTAGLETTVVFDV